jgi:hypothetical protein
MVIDCVRVYHRLSRNVNARDGVSRAFQRTAIAVPGVLMDSLTVLTSLLALRRADLASSLTVGLQSCSRWHSIDLSD